jgi:hypothetical protein
MNPGCFAVSEREGRKGEGERGREREERERKEKEERKITAIRKISGKTE